MDEILANRHAKAAVTDLKGTRRAEADGARGDKGPARSRPKPSEDERSVTAATGGSVDITRVPTAKPQVGVEEARAAYAEGKGGSSEESGRAPAETVTETFAV